MRPLPFESVERFRSDLERLGDVPQRFGVAVSGGPDSIALLLLAWSAFPESFRVATVDHGLRRESAVEAETVTQLCARLDVPHSTLRVEVDASRASLQRTAREARYRALGEWMATERLGTLLTAHHADDQAETLVMRLLRGAGVGGLAGVRGSASLPGSDGQLRVLRPLLGWRKDDLSALIDEAGLTPADDPSNRDERHDRVRVRRLLASAKWLDPAPLARSAAALADADSALEWTARRLWEERVSPHGNGLRLDPDCLPAELKRRLVVRLLSRVGATTAPPRGDEITRLIRRLEEGATATLAGVRCQGGKSWRFERESSRKRS